MAGAFARPRTGSSTCFGIEGPVATGSPTPAERYQRIAGFAVSEGFGQAKALMSAPVSVRQRVLSLLYSPTRGAGLTILRNEISADAGLTIEPKPDKRADRILPNGYCLLPPRQSCNRGNACLTCHKFATDRTQPR